MDRSKTEETQLDDDIDASLEGIITSLAGTNEICISHPDYEEDEPAFLPSDVLKPVTSAWVRRNIPNN